MPLLAELMWIAAYQFLETPEPKPLVQSQVSRPYKPRFVPRVVVKGVERAPPPPPSEWTLVKSGRKRNHSGESESTSGSHPSCWLPWKKFLHRLLAMFTRRGFTHTMRNFPSCWCGACHS
ncbi:hypothetical protein XENOCAPTIV_020955 [Xenoophorus captivus]|uniref:Uncharacterized protein n=1 Tax=Xenoophorus captivus TaxID=1517983 RepID=A0ABV0S936_9TELE